MNLLNRIEAVAANGAISDEELKSLLNESLAGKSFKKALIIPSDYTRAHSCSGKIAAIYYEALTAVGCEVSVMPALGTHDMLSNAEREAFFGTEIPEAAFINHDWRKDVVKIGEIPAEFVKQVSEGLVNEAIDVEVNRLLLDKSFDLIISAGQVVPHEVAGMANYSKNIFVGCGGSSMINSTHMLGAVFGMERVMGKDFSPVRRVFDYAEERFIAHLPLVYALTVTTQHKGHTVLHGLFIGRERLLFEQAVALSQKTNITFVEKPLKKVVAYLDGDEFKSTWLANKAVYRTRMAVADGGELIVIAPGVKKFGEDAANDALIRKYGYVGKSRVLSLCEQNEDIRKCLSVAAHLIHGSSEERFAITYAPGGLSRDETEGVNYRYIRIEEALEAYRPDKLTDGFNTIETNNGPEEVFYISNPAMGLWIDKGRFDTISSPKP